MQNGGSRQPIMGTDFMGVKDETTLKTDTSYFINNPKTSSVKSAHPQTQGTSFLAAKNNSKTHPTPVPPFIPAATHTGALTQTISNFVSQEEGGDEEESPGLSNTHAPSSPSPLGYFIRTTESASQLQGGDQALPGPSPTIHGQPLDQSPSLSPSTPFTKTPLGCALNTFEGFGEEEEEDDVLVSYTDISNDLATKLSLGSAGCIGT